MVWGWVKTAVKGIIHVGYNTIAYLFLQIGAIPPVLKSALNHPPTRSVYRDMLRITLEDLLPFFLVSYSNDLIQSSAQDYLDERDNPAWLSIDTAIIVSLTLLQSLTAAYKLRATLKASTRLAVLLIEASKPLTSIDSRQEMEVCQELKCPPLRFVRGSLRRTLAYWFTKGSIFMLSYFPFIGNPLARVLTIYHNGQYIMSLALPDLCSRQQLEYLKEYPELALSLGITHAATAYLIPFLTEFGVEYLVPSDIQSYFHIESYSDTAKSYYGSTLDLFLVLILVSVAAHMHLPKAVKASSRSIFDPLTLYQAVISWCIDTIGLGLKIKVPKMLKEKKVGIPWGQILGKIESLWNHPNLRLLKKIYLPRVLQSTNGLTHDAVIKPHWEALRVTIISFIEAIEKIKEKWKFPINIAVLSPKKVAKLTRFVFGAPVAVTEIIIKLLGNSFFMEKLGEVRRWLEEMHTDVSPKVNYNPALTRLREPTTADTGSSESLPDSRQASDKEANQPIKPASHEQALAMIEGLKPTIERTRRKLKGDPLALIVGEGEGEGFFSRGKRGKRGKSFLPSEESTLSMDAKHN